jgi:3-dehydroquinate synthase
MAMNNQATIVHVNVPGGEYDIHIGSGLLANISPLMEKALGYTPARAFIIADSNLFSFTEKLEAGLRANGTNPIRLNITGGEATKSFTELERLLESMLAAQPDRRTPVIALGGGVTGDISALCASLLLRGVPMIQCPTTLLSQVDSSVGGKTAINSRHGKNLIGSFFQPKLVIADTDTLATLPQREMLAGYAEIVKYGLLGDATFFSWLEENGSKLLEREPTPLVQAITHSCTMKAAIVARDPHEKHERMLLNLGHTFGHALEKAFDYDGRLLHGEAVAIGMYIAAHYSALHHGLSADAVERIAAHYRAIGLPLTAPPLPPHANAIWLTDVMKGDKKSENQSITLVLPEAIGKAVITKHAPETFVTACWRALGY